MHSYVVGLVIFGLNLHRHPYVAYSSSEGSDMTGWMCRLPLAFPAWLCYLVGLIIIGLNLHRHPYVIHASCEGSNKTAWMCWLPLAFDASICIVHAPKSCVLAQSIFRYGRCSKIMNISCMPKRSSQTGQTNIRLAGPRSAVGNVSGYRCVSDCRSRGREFNPGLVPYFRGD